MTGLGLAVLWIGYTSFAYGHALTKGANVTFTDMVLPSHRAYALEQIKHAQLPQQAQAPLNASPTGQGGLLQQALGFLTGGLVGDSRTAPQNLVQGK